MNYFLLATLLGLVVRFISRQGILHYVYKSRSDEELKQVAGFHISVISYVIGTGMSIISGTFLIAMGLSKFL